MKNVLYRRLVSLWLASLLFITAAGWDFGGSGIVHADAEDGNLLAANTAIAAPWGGQNNWSASGYTISRSLSADENFAVPAIPALTASYTVKGKLRVDTYGAQGYHGARVIFRYDGSGHFLELMLSKSGAGYVLEYDASKPEVNHEISVFSYPVAAGTDYSFEILSEPGQAVIKLGGTTVFEGAVPVLGKGVAFYSAGSAVTFSELAVVPSGNLLDANPLISTPWGGQNTWSVNGYTVARSLSADENYALLNIPALPGSYQIKGKLRVDTFGAQGYHGARVLFRYDNSGRFLELMLSKSGVGYVLEYDTSKPGITSEIGLFSYPLTAGTEVPFEILSRPGQALIKLGGQTVFEGAVPDMGKGVGLYSAGSAVTFSEMGVYLPSASSPAQTDLFHDQAAPYMDPVAPQSTQPVSLRLRSAVNALTAANIQYYDTGDSANHTVAMTKLAGTDATGKFEFWTGTIPASPAYKTYRFKVTKANGTQAWYTAYGEYTAEPGQRDDDYAVSPGFDTPAWSKEAIYYSVMPDSFYNGDPDNDVRAGYDDKLVPIGWGKNHVGGNDWFGGDLEGLKQKLSYVKDTVGATAVYVNPVFASYHNAGYGQFDYKTVNPFLGTNKELQSLVASAHADDLKFVMDGVYLYSLYDSKWVDKNGRFPETGAAESAASPFHDRYYWSAWPNFDSSGPKLPFGMPKLNYASAALKDDLYRGTDSAMQHFLRAPYGIDGWRLDVPAFNDDTTEGLAVEREMRTYMKAVNPNAVLIGELGYSEEEFKGDTLDSRWNYARFRDPLVSYLQSGTTTTQWAKKMGQAIADIPRPFAMSQYNLLDSHDTPRILREVGENEKLAKLALVYQMTFVGAPVVYYGDEIGYSSGGPYDSMQSFDWADERWNQDTFNTYRSLIELRKTYPALTFGAYKNLLADDASQVMAYGRWDADHQLIVATNKDAAAHEVTVSAEELSVTDGTVMYDWLTGQSYTVAAGKVTLNLPAQSAAILIAGAGAGQLGSYRGQWLTEDIGNPAAAGQASLGTDGKINLKGSGTIGGTQDGFRYLYRSAFGDFELAASVVSQSAAAGEAGLMLRQSEDADAPFYKVTLSAAGFQTSYRTESGAAAAAGGTAAAPAGTNWIKAVRQGNQFRAYYAPDNAGSPGAWTLVPGSARSIAMDKRLLSGLGVSSNGAGENSAVFGRTLFTQGAQALADHFDGSVMSSMWTGLYPNAGSAAVAGGKLVLQADQGKRNMLAATPPLSDWSAKVKLSFTSAADGQEAGLMAYGDNNNAVRLTRVRDNGGWKLSLLSTINGYDDIRTAINDPSAGADLYLQLNRVGAYVSAMYSLDGTHWISLNATPIQANFSSWAVGPAVLRGTSATAVSASFDDFAFGDYDTASSTAISVPASGQAALVFQQPKPVKWSYEAGSWTDIGEGYEQSSTSEAAGRMNLKGKSYGDLLADITIGYKSLQVSGEAGISLRRTAETDAPSASGYQIALDQSGALTVYKAGTALAGADHRPTGADMNQDIRLRIFLEGGLLKVFVNDWKNPFLTVNDNTYGDGYVSLYTKHANAVFKNTAVYPLNQNLQTFEGSWVSVTGGFKSQQSGMAVIAGQAYRDLTLQSTIRFDAGAPADAWGGFLLHGEQGALYGQSGYDVRVDKSGTISINGVGAVSSGINPVNNPLPVKVVIRGDQVKVYVNGSATPLIDRQIAGKPSGSAAFAATGGGISFTGNTLSGDGPV